MRSSVILACFVVGVSSSRIANAEVLIVTGAPATPTEFSTIQAAIDASSDGDSILVRNGDYAPFVVDGKSLTISADTEQFQVEVGRNSSVTSRGRTVVRNLTANQRCVLSGLVLTALELTGNAGAVWVENCSVYGSPACVIRDCARVDMVADQIFAFDTQYDSLGKLQVEAEPGLLITNSASWFAQCSIGAGSGNPAFVDPQGVPIPAGSGRPGIVVRGGSLYATDSFFGGGWGGKGTFDASSGTCVGNGEGGPALELHQVDAHLQGCFLFPGIAGSIGDSSMGCPHGATAPTYVTTGGSLVVESAPLRGVSIWPVPMREGDVAELVLSGAAGEVGFLFASPSLAIGPLPLGPAPLVLGPNAQLLAVTPLVGFGTAHATFLSNLPDLPPGIESFEIYFQVGFCGASGCTLSGATHALLLDRRIPAPIHKPFAQPD